MRGGWVVSLMSILSLGATSPRDGRGPRTRALAKAEVARLHVPGLALAVVRTGEPVWTAYFGLADLENHTPVTPRTVFRFASASKPMTAVAALRLVARGRLNLDRPARELLRLEAGSLGEGATLRHLLAHQSGLRHYQPRPGEEPLCHFQCLADALREKAGDAPISAPGARFSYSTHGYTVVGRMMELVEGRPFEVVMAQEVFAPGRMTHARVDDTHALIPYRARGYFWSLNGDWRNSAAADLSGKVPGGGLCGTLGDLAAFASAVLAHRLLPEAFTEGMWAPHPLSDGRPSPYGLGWYLDVHGGVREAYHPGTQAGASSLVYLQVDRGIGVVCLGNLEQAAFLPLARRVAEVWGPPHRARGVRTIRR